MQSRKKFFYNGAVMTVAALLLRSVAMFFSAYFSRTVGEVGVGLYTVIMTVYSFLLTFATSGVSLTVTLVRTEEANGLAPHWVED